MRKQKLLLFILVSFLIIGGAYLFFNFNDKGVNKKIGVENSNSDSLAVCDFDKNTDNITIDFSECKKCSGTTYVGFGSTSYKFLGKQNNKCVFYYKSEIEAPNGGAKLDTECSVRSDVGKMSFKVSSYGIDFSSISNFCK